MAAERAALPGEVLAAIDSASMYVRHDNNLPRIIVQPEGWTGFIYSDDSAERWLNKAFPGQLNEQQKGSAVRYMAALVRNHHRESQPKRQRTNWMNRWRYDEID